MTDEEEETPEPVAPAPPAANAGMDSPADPATRDLLAALTAEQIGLAIMQRQHLHMQHIRDRFLLAFDLSLAVGGVVIVAIIVALFWDAWTSRSVIVDPFDVPASFAAQGVSGRVVASELLDRLKAFQDATRTNQLKRAVADAWSNKIELRIPEAGISIDEVENLLHRWLSRDEHISGSVVEDGSGIALTIRGDRFSARTFTGKRQQLHALTIKAAEYVYGGSEPYLFGVYLEEQGRAPEVIVLAQSAFSMASRSDKPLLLSVWSNALADLGRYREARDKAREAVRLDPRFWLGYDNMMGDEQSLGEEEEIVDTGRDMERLARRGSWLAADVPAGYWQNLDNSVADWPAFHRDVVFDMAQNGGQGTENAAEAPIDAEALARMHDWRGAELELETSPGTNTDHYVIAQSAFVRAIIALDEGDFAHAAALMRTADKIASTDSSVASNLAAPWACWLARAEALSGDSKKVDADIARGGRFVDCYRFKGDIADRRGDWPAAQKDYAAAVALAPSIPSSYESWGEGLARHGHADAAFAEFALAHEKGPHWADPLEHWGEVLAGEGRFEDAIAKYKDASAYAPDWGSLYLDWGRALDRLQRHDEAREKFHRAWSLDLAPHERMSIAGCCGRQAPQ
ncbi:MAG TPA: tetratricopeptide repeat protein [Rhizomicrobium sp.]|nr:tetratricopeptide repeat protein [Rhizomicrobium sp.]